MSTASTSTVAPGAVVPVTVVVVPDSAFCAGAVIVTVVPAWVWVTYRAVVSAGRSVTVPARRSAASRTNWACAQVSGEALPAALPAVNPIEAHSGAVPNADAGWSASSQACSGIRPIPEAVAAIPVSSVVASAVLPTDSECSARSPDSTGHRWPEPWFWDWPWQAPAHGLP